LRERETGDDRDRDSRSSGQQGGNKGGREDGNDGGRREREEGAGREMEEGVGREGERKSPAQLQPCRSRHRSSGQPSTRATSAAAPLAVKLLLLAWRCSRSGQPPASSAAAIPSALPSSIPL
jgi:hypothetical protein